MARVGTASKNTWNFLPTTIPSCSLWLDAADLSTMFTNLAGTERAVVGDRVRRWNDKSPNASFASQATDDNRPIIQNETTTALTSLNFTGGSQLLALPNGAMLPLGTSDGTYFVVCRSSTSLAFGSGALMAPFSHGGGTAAAGQSRSFIVTPTSNSGFICQQTGTITAINTYVPVLLTGGIKDYIQYGFANGLTNTGNNLINFQGSTFVTSGGTLSTNGYIGQTAGAGQANAFIGNVSEIIVFNRALDNYERQQIEGYLSFKWGITPVLPEATHPYYNPLAQGFTPYIGGGSLRLWLDASTLSGENNSPVTTWTGLTANNGLSDSSPTPNMSTTTAPTLATNSLNGRNTVAFNGSQFMDLTSPGIFASVGSSMEIFFVAQTTNSTPPSRQTVFSQGGVAYPNALNTSTPFATEGYFNSSNNLSFDTLGVPTGLIPTSTSVYTNKYVLGVARVSGGIPGAWNDGNAMTGNSYSINLLRQTARIGGSRPLSTMRLTGTSSSGTATIEVLSGGPPCVNQIINFSHTAASPGIGGILSGETPTAYFITNVIGTSSPYTITVSLTYGGASPTLTTTTGQTVPAQAFTTINATTISSSPPNTVTITSSTAPTINQPIIFGGSVGGINARARYYIVNIVNSAAAPSYVVQLSTTPSGSVFPITSTTINQGVPELLVNNYFTGNIAEMIYYINTSFTTGVNPQRQRIEGYLAWKWGLQAQLPTTHPFYLANYFYNSTRPLSRLFAPPDIEGCQLWIDPTDMSTVGYAVSAWTDKSSGANHATQTTASLQPYYIPSQKALYFGTSEYLSISNLALFQNIGYASMFIVMRIPPGTTLLTQNTLFVATGGTGGNRFTPTIFPSGSPNATYGAIVRRADADSDSILSSNTISYPYGGITILNIEVNYSTTPPTATFSRNGTQDFFTNSTGLTTGLTNTTSTGITIPSSTTSSRQSNFYIHEILLYTSSGTGLTTTERNDNNGYLAWKWGIQNSLPSSNPYSPFNTSPASSRPSGPVTGSKLWLDGADAANITRGTTVAMLTDKSGSENAAVNNASTLTMTTYTKPEGTTLPILLGPNPGTSNSLTTRSTTRDTSNHSYAFVVKYPASGTAPTTVLSHYSPPITSSSPTASFVPTQIAGCALWLDAADSSTVSVSGSNVTGWTDKSAGYTSTASNNTAIQYIPNAIGSLPVIRIGATAAFFTFGNINNIGTQEFNIFAVFKASPTGANSIIGKGSMLTTGWWFGCNATGSALQTQYNAVSITYTNTSGLQNYIIASSMNPRTSVPTHYYNGSSIGTGTANSTNLTNTSNLRVGSSGDNFNALNTDFAEIIMYIGAISTAQREQIEGYLAWKWGLAQSLPVSHPYSYYSNPPKISSPGGTETFGHSGTTAPQLENNNAIPAGGNTYALYTGGPFASADAFYGGSTFVCLCVRQNGVWTFTTNGQSYTTVAPNALKNLASGQYSLGVNNGSGVQLGDVVVYNYALTAGERQQLEGYLMWKWGIQRSGNSKIPFPTTHPFYKYPPVTTLPIVNATQTYKKAFDITDLGPALWLDANDPNTYVLDANNRVQWITNKGLGGLKATFNISAVANGTDFTINNSTPLSPGQAFEITASTVSFTGITTVVSTPSAPVFFFVHSYFDTSRIRISSTFGGPPLSGTVSSSTACYVSQRFTRQTGAVVITAGSGSGTTQTYTCVNNLNILQTGQNVTITGLSPAGFNVVNQPILTHSTTQITVAGVTTGSSTGTGLASLPTQLNGPLLTQSAVGTGNGLNYLDFSSGGTFRITGASTDSAGTSVVLTLNALHNIPANRQVRVVVSGGTYSTNSASAAGITNTYIVSAQTGTTITIPYNSSQSSATINNVVGYVEYGSIILSAISIPTNSSTATFTTSFPHGLATLDSVFLSLAGVTIAGVSVPLNLANGVYSVTFLTSTTFSVNLLNLGASAIISSSGVSVTSLLSTTSPSYAYFPYNGYCLESRSATNMIAASTVQVFVVTHTNPGASGLAASSIARCGRNVETQPPIFATAVTANNVSGSDTNTGGATVFGNGRDFNVRLANYNAVGNQLTPSTIPSIRIGVKRNALSITSAALSDTNRTVTNTTNGFRVMSAFIMYSSNSSLEVNIYGTAVTSCGWKPTSFNNSNTNNTVGVTPLANTTYANNTGVLPVYEVSSTGGSDKNATATFLPYGIEPNYVPYYAGQSINIFGMGGTASGYNNASATVSSATSTTFSYTTLLQQTAGTFTGQAGTINLTGIFSQTPSHIRIGADTNATSGYSSLAGYLTDRFFDGGIAEVLVFTGVLTPEQRMLVEGYLAQKYNFQDNLGSPGVIIPPQSVANDISNVTASGTTATIRFVNTISPSVNPFVVGSQIVVGGTIAPAGFVGTFVVSGVSGTSQVSYTLASAIGNSSSVSGVTVSSPGNLITNLTSFVVTAATSSGSTATITFTNPLSPNVNPFVPGAQIVVGGISPSGYSSTFVVVSTTGANQVSYSTVGSNLGTATLTNATVSSTRTQTNQFIHPYSAGPANIASNLALSGAFTQNLALWYDAANYSSLTVDPTTSGVLTWSSRLGNVASTQNVLAPHVAGFNFKYVANSQNGLPGLEVISTVALTGVTLTATAANPSNLLTVTSSTPIVANQLIRIASAVGNLNAINYYVVRSPVTVAGSNIYNFTVARNGGGAAVTLSATTGQSIACRLFTGGSLKSSAAISASTLTTANTNTEFTYFYVLKRVSQTVQNNMQVNLISTATGNPRINLGENVFTMIDAGNNTLNTSIDYSTRGGFLNDTTMILSVYKRGRDLYSRMIGGGKMSQFVQTFSRDNQIPPSTTLTLFMGIYDDNSNYSFNGTLYEMMFFRDALTDQAIQQTEGYLAQKWGLTGSLPQTHAYYEIKT